MLKPLYMILVAAFALLLTGCSGLQGIASPTVEVLGARVVEQSGQGASLAVMLRVVNPNIKELAMPRVTCDLDVVGGGRFTFTDVPYATVPGRGEQVVMIPAAMLGSGLLGKRFTVRGTVVFQPEGQVRRVLSDMGVPLPRTAFSGEGVIGGGGVVEPMP